MTEHISLAIASIFVLGITAQWLAWRIHLPSILILLIFGFLAGPVSGLLDPDELLGELLFPAVSVSVALILFEGGLSLRIRELRLTGHVVRNLATIGALVTWVLSAGAAYLILGFNFSIALLFGAILVVTGPTVIIPLLQHVRAVGRVSSVAKWEGIVNDPVGAVLAVLVFEAILASGIQETAITVIISLIQTLIIGLVFGGITAWGLIQFFKRYWIPDYLQNSVTLMTVIAVFVASNVLQQESGLVTVTLMGILLANQKSISIRHIIEFKENIGILLLSSLFILLAARLDSETLSALGFHSLIFLAVLIIIVRPVTILLSTIKSGLRWQEKAFLAWMAPRGIVAAAVTAVFALELVEVAGFVEAEAMVPEMFIVIVGTVTIYGLSASYVGRWLGVAQPNPQGALIVGAHGWARSMAKALQAEGYQVLLIDTNRRNLNQARLEGLPTFYASILSEYIIDELELGSIGRLLALTPNDEVNALATLHFTEIFARSEVYQLPPRKTGDNRQETISLPLRGRLLFNLDATYGHLTRCIEAGWIIKTTQLTRQFNYKAFQELYGDNVIPLFLINETGSLTVFTTDQELSPQPGNRIISLVKPAGEAA